MIGLREDPGSSPPPASRMPALVAQAFAEGGWLQQALKLEHRPQQEQMARAVAGAMSDDEVLLFEAGTGVGKSLAYLVPGILHAIDQTRQMIVSTHTISLQEQIEMKDLPLCRRLFESVDELRPYAKFKSAVLVGKANYLCTTRLAHALQSRQELFASADQEELQRIAAWAGNRARASGMNSIRRRHPRSGRRSTPIPPPAATRIAAANIVSTSARAPASATPTSSSSTTACSSPT
jgi:ATP-dependent DNA helicase DinG